jgi:putative transposase
LNRQASSSALALEHGKRAYSVSARPNQESWLESGAVYSYRKVCSHLRDLGETCGKHRVYRLMQQEHLCSQTGYRRRAVKHGGRPVVVADNHLQRQFDVQEPSRVRVTNITYIRTHEGWLYLAAVLGLFANQQSA